MAHVSRDDIDAIWRQVEGKGWPALRQALKARAGGVGGISDTLVHEMERQSEQLEKVGARFPASSQELYELMNRRLVAVRE